MKRAALTSLLLTANLLGCHADALRLGSPIAADLSRSLTEVAEDTMAAFWITTAEGCLGCDTPDYALRQVVGAKVPLLAIVVGVPSDTNRVRSFLTDRRVAAHIALVSAREGEALIGGRELPVAGVVRRGALVWTGRPDSLVAAIGSQ